MADPRRTDPREGASLQELVAHAIRDAVELARKEFALFRAEMADNVGSIAKGAAFFAVAAVFAVASLIWLTQALVYGLAIIVQSTWIAALIVGVLLAVVAGAFVLAGKSLVTAATLAPTRTVRSIKRDGEVISERTP